MFVHALKSLSSQQSREPRWRQRRQRRERRRQPALTAMYGTALDPAPQPGPERGGVRAQWSPSTSFVWKRVLGQDGVLAQRGLAERGTAITPCSCCAGRRSRKSSRVMAYSPAAMSWSSILRATDQTTVTEYVKGYARLRRTQLQESSKGDAHAAQATRNELCELCGPSPIQTLELAGIRAQLPRSDVAAFDSLRVNPQLLADEFVRMVQQHPKHASDATFLCAELFKQVTVDDLSHDTPVPGAARLGAWAEADEEQQATPQSSRHGSALTLSSFAAKPEQAPEPEQEPAAEPAQEPAPSAMVQPSAVGLSTVVSGEPSHWELDPLPATEVSIPPTIADDPDERTDGDADRRRHHRRRRSSDRESDSASTKHRHTRSGSRSRSVGKISPRLNFHLQIYQDRARI